MKIIELNMRQFYSVVRFVLVFREEGKSDRRIKTALQISDEDLSFIDRFIDGARKIVS